MKNQTLYIAFFLIVVNVFVSGCATYMPIEKGIIATEGMTITAEDGNFTLRSGVEFTTPFSVDIRNTQMFSGNLIANSGVALDAGGRRVKVSIPGQSKPLFGVLVLLNKRSNATGPASRMYQIAVPQNYIAAAMGGQVSVVYELMDYAGRSPGFERESAKGLKYPYAWILWLSDQPFR